MSDTPPVTQPKPAVPADQRPIVLICYFLFLIACINGLTALIGLVIAYSQRREAAGTLWRSHFDNLILVFWVFVAAVLIAILSWPLGLWALFVLPFLAHPTALIVWPAWLLIFPLTFGLVVFPILVIWYFYRTIRGTIRAAEGRPYRG